MKFDTDKDGNIIVKADENQPSTINSINKSIITAYGDISNSNRKRLDLAQRTTINDKDLGLTKEDIDERKELGISPLSNISNKKYNKIKADSQSAFEQFGNFLMQAGVGEVILGTFEGFGNIVDGVINSFTGDQYGVNPYTQFMHEAKESINKEFEIYQEDPTSSWNLSDSGWWFQNAVSVASTLSLMLPAAGWTRALGSVGKLSKANKLFQWSAKGISRGLNKAVKTEKGIGKFESIKKLAGQPSRIQQSLESTTKLTSQAVLSRAGENYMEAREIYNTIYSDSKENLENMPNEEYAKFIEMNPEFKDMSKDDIAKEIARKSANKTFYNDYWMLLMDIPQFKALGSLWGKGVKRHVTASERIAARNAKLSLAGVADDKLIKNNFLNRQKEHIRYALKNPKESFLALNLGEGFEEMYQGIQSEKGMEVATKYFDPTFTPRSIDSYLTDGSIWEQFFWGTMGAIAFNFGYNRVKDIEKGIKNIHNKKHMSADEYERWKTTEDKLAISQIESITENTRTFISEMEQINEGKNPYEYAIDASTGRKIIKDGELQNATINEEQKDLLKQEAIRKFVDTTTLDAVDRGIDELMMEILNSNEFDSFIEKNGLKLTAADKSLSKQVADRMKNVASIYKLALNDVNSVADAVNPYVTRAAARNITKYKLSSEIYDNAIFDIESELQKANTENIDISNYENSIINTAIEREIDKLFKRHDVYKAEYANGVISKSAYKKHADNIKREIDNLLSEYRIDNASELVKDLLGGTRTLINKTSSELLDTNIFNEYNSFISRYKENISDINKSENTQLPPSTIQDLVKEKAKLKVRKIYNDSNIPKTNKEYQEIYDEFGLAMDAVARNRIEKYIDDIKNYLRSADDFEQALSKLLNEETGNKKIDEAASYLKYGYISEEGRAMRFKDIDTGRFHINTQFDTLIASLLEERKKADKRVQEANEQGITIPSNEEVEQQLKSEEEQDDKSPSSTGEEIKTNDKDPVVYDSIDDDTGKLPNDSPVEEYVDDNPIITSDSSSADIYESDENPINDKELQDTSDVAESYVTESNTASIEADMYIKKVAFTQINKIEEITKALSNGDTSKQDQFIDEIVNYLVDKGYDEKLSKKIAKDSFIKISISFALMDSKNAFGKLVQQLALGIDEETAKKYSVTELIEGKGIDEIIDKFLEEYNKLVGSSKTNDGISIINIEALFDYLLNDANVDVGTASHIYNNINNFISTHDGSKYKFTGFNVSRNRMTANDFFNRLKEIKANTVAGMNQMHISPIERDKRNEDYNKAIEAVARGAKSFIVEERDRDGDVPNLAIYVPIVKNKKTVNVKIGILRTVDVHKDLDGFSPRHHWSGFANNLKINNDGSISLDCDFLFEDLINNHDTDKDTKTLFNDILQYVLNVQDIMDRLNSGRITDKAAAKELSESMDLETAKRILNNPIIKQALNSKVYKIYNEAVKDDIEKAKTISKSIASILFYGHDFDTSDPANNPINTIAVDKLTMAKRYEEWKDKVHFNYEHTYELQKSFSDETKEIFINTNVINYTVLNTINDPKEYVNIEDAGFDIDPNSPDYTPLVMVNREGYLMDESGKTYGLAPLEIQPYSMGFLVHDENDVKLVAYCNTAQELNQSPITKALKNEIADIIIRQLNNKNLDTHDNVFDTLKNKLFEMFEAGSLFKFAQDSNGKNRIKIKTISDGSVVTISFTDETGSNEKNLLSFFLKNKDGVTNSNAIGLYIPRLNKQVPITVIKDTTYNNTVIKEDEIRAALNSVIDTLFSTVKLNRSLTAMTNERIQGETPTIFTKEDGKFIVHLGNKDYVYESYADFILQNRGFNTNVNGSGNKSFIVKYVNNDKITIDTRVKDVSQVNQETNTNVSDLLFNNKNEKRKTVDTEEVLAAAGVPKESIDALLTKIDGVPIVTSKIRIDEDYDKDEDTNAYYNTKDGNIYITSKGANSMNNNPRNAIRLILHENLHRLFHNKSKYSDKERERILNELKEVYDYTIECLTKDKNSGKITEELYNSIISVLNKATISDNEQINMEEFLVESLTQPIIINYLNNTNYHSEVKIDGIPTKAKSIFQKIIDILLDLLGIKSNRIKNNTILAREYMILSKTTNPTTGGMFTKKLDDKSSINSEKLDTARKDVDKIRKGFESRIKRSPNFKKDHKYLIDGVEVDYSVTQKIHGEQDLGKWSLPSSLIGNTADEAARQYFNNDDKLTGPIPNVINEGEENSIQSLEDDLHKIREYLDKRFGKGRYGVITEEFPIGGTIIVNGEEKTIAGTMDMLVYTDTGDIYIFDFKTKRLDNDGNANISENTLNGYSQQVNIYRQLIEANYPEFKGKVHVGGLIKFAVDYPNPNEFEYRENPNIEGQLQVRESKDDEFLNIQESYVDYYAPFFFGNEDFEKEHIINIEDKDYSEEIKQLPKITESDINIEDEEIKIKGEELLDDKLEKFREEFNESIDDFDTGIDDIDDYDLYSATELIEYNEEEQEIIKNASTELITDTEIYATPIVNGNTDNSFGIKVVNDMNEFIDSFPVQYRESIKQILAENELNYTCQ